MSNPTSFPINTKITVVMIDGQVNQFIIRNEEHINHQKYENGLQVTVSHEKGLDTSFYTWHSIKAFHVETVQKVLVKESE